MDYNFKLDFISIDPESASNVNIIKKDKDYHEASFKFELFVFQREKKTNNFLISNFKI